VLTWNLQARAFKIEQIRESIQQWDPDIVCTQETYHDSFADLLPGYQHRRGSDSRIFSRLPILDHRRVTIGTTPPRKAILCEIETPSGPLSVLALHLPRATERGGIPRELGALAEHVTGGMHVRAEKFGDLLEWLPEDRPLLVVGDMNTPPASRHYRDLARHLTDAFAARGTGFGYTWLWRSRWPMMRIDYIWCGGGVRPVTCFTGEAGLTDHRQLIADVLVPES